MTKPKVSILMSAYNADDFIEISIQSILKQTYENWELLIGDDCSTDSTFEIISNFALNDKRIKVFRQEQNIGYLKNCNSIWQHATGEYITFQDADDWSNLSRLEIQYNFMIKNRDVDLCSTNYYRVNKYHGNRLINIFSNNVNKKLDNYIDGNEENFPVYPNSLFFKKTVSDTLGFYKTFFSRKCGEDWDWILRANRQFKISCIQDALYYYRENPNGVTQNITVDNQINENLIKSIHKTYRSHKIELLDNKNIDQLLSIEKKLKKPFLKDKSLIFFMRAQNAVYHKSYGTALANILRAILKNPFKTKYYRVLKFTLYSRLFVKY